jgi:hypothetical protein
MHQSRLIIWDFDGVICDSLVECITVTRVAASRIEQPGLDVNEKNLHEICCPDVIMALYERMRHLRPFIVKGQDYLWQYFNLDLYRSTPTSSKDYKSIFDGEFDAVKDKEYEKGFYEARRLIQQLMKQQYFTLFRPYPGILYAFRTALLRNRNYICTARDQQGVSLLLGQNAIAFPREKILSKDFTGIVANEGKGKAEQMLDILDREGGRDQNFLLIEDQVKAPAELKDICPNMEVIFASYGYGLELDWINAGIAGLKTVSAPENLVYNIY